METQTIERSEELAEERVNILGGLPAVADQPVTGQQDGHEATGAVDSIETPILAGGLLFGMAKLISRFVVGFSGQGIVTPT